MIFIIIIIIIFTLLIFMNERFEKNKCTIKNCGAIDPVSDPSYNMKNVVKQTILLEEHLAEENKYCIDCILKHFLHCQGLLEEGIWLACDNLDKYPLITESDKLYKKLFDIWIKNRENKTDKNKKEVRNILSELRNIRKKLADKYYLNV